MTDTATLTRFAYLPQLTLGWLVWGPLRLATIERPWIPVPDHRGGKIRESCIPDGEYKLLRHSGPGFRDVFALANPDLDVHYMPAARGRSAILIHAGNRVRDVVGCIAIGRSHGRIEVEPAVIDSQLALNDLRQAWKPLDPLPSLVIQPTAGTTGGAPWQRPN